MLQKETVVMAYLDVANIIGWQNRLHWDEPNKSENPAFGAGPRESQ